MYTPSAALPCKTVYRSVVNLTNLNHHVYAHILTTYLLLWDVFITNKTPWTKIYIQYNSGKSIITVNMIFKSVVCKKKSTPPKNSILLQIACVGTTCHFLVMYPIPSCKKCLTFDMMYIKAMFRRQKRFFLENNVKLWEILTSYFIVTQKPI